MNAMKKTLLCMFVAVGAAFWVTPIAQAGKYVGKAFPNFNEDPSFPSVGIFWQDGIANTAMFYFLNQGIVMR